MDPTVSCRFKLQQYGGVVVWRRSKQGTEFCTVHVYVWMCVCVTVACYDNICILALPSLPQSRCYCLQPVPHWSWRGKLRRILTSLQHCARPRYPETQTQLHMCTQIHSGSHAPCERVCTTAMLSSVVCQEDPWESDSQMCPLALMAALAGWMGKTPWRFIYLNRPLELPGNKLTDISGAW